jgi:hypothetical protein
MIPITQNAFLNIAALHIPAKILRGFYFYT